MAHHIKHAQLFRDPTWAIIGNAFPEWTRWANYSVRRQLIGLSLIQHSPSTSTTAQACDASKRDFMSKQDSITGGKREPPLPRHGPCMCSILMLILLRYGEIADSLVSTTYVRTFDMLDKHIIHLAPHVSTTTQGFHGIRACRLLVFSRHAL